MNRTIKFRVWIARDREMDYEPTLQTEDMFISINDVISGKGDVNLNANPTWMQYTGFEDGNGKEIYESDILEWAPETKEGHQYIVKWDNGSFVLEFMGSLAGHIWGRLSRGMILAFQEESMLVICGNLYENPELAKQAGAK